MAKKTVMTKTPRGVKVSLGWTFADIAEHVGASEATVRAIRQKHGGLPWVAMQGRRMYFEPAQVKAWFKAYGPVVRGRPTRAATQRRRDLFTGVHAS